MNSLLYILFPFKARPLKGKLKGMFGSVRTFVYSLAYNFTLKHVFCIIVVIPFEIVNRTKLVDEFLSWSEKITTVAIVIVVY